MSYDFHAAQATEQCIQWIRDWFLQNGPQCRAVIGISGGKDSSVAAALMVKALGRERVLGVLMPQGTQTDIDVSIDLCRTLDIASVTVNIKDTVQVLRSEIEAAMGCTISEQSRINLPPRIRMSTLYAISQSVNGRVINTCNLSEDWVGYSTRYGDSAGDMSPLGHFTVREVKAIGRCLGLPDRFVEKAPSDGLCGKTDEDNLGFTYEELDRYIREGIEPAPDKKARIDSLHLRNLFKLQLLPTFEYKEPEALNR